MVLIFLYVCAILPATAGRLYETYQVLLFLQNNSRSFNNLPAEGVVEHLSFNIYYFPTGFT
jgi:hypothetical protein